MGEEGVEFHGINPQYLGMIYAQIEKFAEVSSSLPIERNNKVDHVNHVARLQEVIETLDALLVGVLREDVEKELERRGLGTKIPKMKEEWYIFKLSAPHNELMKIKQWYREYVNVVLTVLNTKYASITT